MGQRSREKMCFVDFEGERRNEDIDKDREEVVDGKGFCKAEKVNRDGAPMLDAAGERHGPCTISKADAARSALMMDIYIYIS